MDDINVKYSEIKTWDKESYVLVDMRDDSSIGYGMIPGAIHIPEEKIDEKIDDVSEGKKVVIYCTRGVFSAECAGKLREQKNIEAYSLEGGYTGWILENIRLEEEKEEDGSRKDDIEKSIRKKFHKQLFSKFAKAINTYELVKEHDKIAVCISGGKDSMLMAKLFQELKRHNKFEFELVFLVMDPGYSEANRKVIENNAKLMDKDDFFYTYITVERPLRLIYKDVKTKYAALDEKKQSEALANIVALDDIDTERTDAEFFAYLESKKIKTTAKLIKDCRTFFGEVSETAPEVHVIPLDDNSDLVADTNLRDYESIPFKTDIQEYFQNEVLRFAPDAWMDREKDKIGCEFPISKLFYEYQPLRSVEDILADIRALEEDEEQELSSLLND